MTEEDQDKIKLEQELEQKLQEEFTLAAVKLTDAQVHFIAVVMKRIVKVHLLEGEEGNDQSGDTGVPDVW